MDATLTLAQRLLRGEKIWLAHRNHFYQQATGNGFSVLQVVGRVFALNVMLAVLAAIATAMPSTTIQIAMLVAGLAGVAFVLRGFSRSR